MIQAAIFDMDGLLVDSEPLWTRAEMEVFATVGIDLDPAQCAQTVGMGLFEVVAHRHSQKPWKGRSLQDVARAIHMRVVELIREQAEPMPGARAAIGLARTQGSRVGLATTSDRALIDAVIDRLGLHDVFDHVQSASELSHGKPHPEVYLVTAARLGVDPLACLALEDSIPGLIAAKAARMTAVAVPERRQSDDPRFSLADVVLPSLERLDAAVWQRLQAGRG